MKTPFLACAALWLGVGCGDISSAETLVAGAGGATSATTGATGGHASSTGARGTTGPSATSASSSASAGGQSTASVSVSASSTTADVASSSTGVQASVVSSTATGGTRSVACGNMSCPIGDGGGCCSDIFQGNGGQTKCLDGNHASQCDPQSLETLITCQTAADCSLGQTCCGHRVFAQGTTYYETVSCQSSCSWPDGVVLCDPQSLNLTQCPIVNNGQGPQQTQCQPSELLPQGYSVCNPM